MDIQMRVHRCGELGCRELIALSERYCSKHQKVYVKDKLADRNYNRFSRDQEANAFYQSRQWKRMRYYIDARDMNICQVCGNVLDDRKIIDHIVPLKVANDKRLDDDNLWTLCYRCHNIKTSVEQGMSDNQLKHVGRAWWYKIIQERIAQKP